MIGGLVLGPAAIFFRVAMDRARDDNGAKSALGVDGEMLKLCLSHLARFWKIGSVFLGTSTRIYLIMMYHRAPVLTIHADIAKSITS